MLIGQDPILEAGNEVNLTHSLGTESCGDSPKGSCAAGTPQEGHWILSGQNTGVYYTGSESGV